MRKYTHFFIWYLIFVAILVPINSIADTKIRVGVYQNRPLLFSDTDGKVKRDFCRYFELCI